MSSGLEHIALRVAEDKRNMSIEANIKARKAAEELWELVVEECFGIEDVAIQVYWKRFLELLRVELWSQETVARDPPMTDDEAKRFGSTQMPFGKWELCPIDDVPMEYFVWMEEQPDFRRQLNAWLRNPRIQQRQENGE